MRSEPVGDLHGYLSTPRWSINQLKAWSFLVFGFGDSLLTITSVGSMVLDTVLYSRKKLPAYPEVPTVSPDVW